MVIDSIEYSTMNEHGERMELSDSDDRDEEDVNVITSKCMQCARHLA